MRHRHTLVLAAALLAAACDSSTAPARYSAEGRWAGQETTGSTLVALSLTQRGDSVSGTGTVTGAREIVVTAEGSAVTTEFSVTLSAAGFQPVQIIGGFTARNEIEAYMVGSGFYGDPILLHRQ